MLILAFVYSCLDYGVYLELIVLVLTWSAGSSHCSFRNPGC